MERSRKTTKEEVRNEGVEEQSRKLHKPDERPPRHGARQPSPPVDDPVDEDEPAATEHLENPPQVESARERVNDPDKEPN